MWRKEIYTLLAGMSLWTILWIFFKKLKTTTTKPDDPSIFLTGVYPKEMKALCQGGMCILMFITALFKHIQEMQSVSTSGRGDNQRTCTYSYRERISSKDLWCKMIDNCS